MFLDTSIWTNYYSLQTDGRNLSKKTIICSLLQVFSRAGGRKCGEGVGSDWKGSGSTLHPVQFQRS